MSGVPFREGIISKAHRLLYHSTLGRRVTNKKRRRLGARRQRSEVTVYGFVADRWAGLCYARPFEPYPRPVLGAIDPYLEPFVGIHRPKNINIFKH